MRKESILQNELDTIGVWTSMKLNTKKCKEIIVFFRQSIIIDENICLERKEFHKVLGSTVRNNLKRDLHISKIATKASKSKRLHIEQNLQRNGVSPSDVLRVCSALIRSALEYRPVRHSSLTIN